MSVTPSSNAPVAFEGDLTGLEDVETTDLVMPRLSIDHDTGEIVDSLSGERHEKLTVVPLGLVKQRVLWPPEMGEENAPPLCRSYDFHEGRPGERFPWRDSGFDPNEFNGQDANDVVLPCAACPLKEWGSHPNRDIQWCAEQHVYPLMVPSGDSFAPALFTVQRSGIKSSRAYLSSFARAKTPLYTAFMNLSLTGNRRGKVSYYVPKFAKGQPTDTDDWAEYAHTYRSIRDFLQTPRTRDDEGTSSSVSPGSSSNSTTSSSKPPPSTGATDNLGDDDELPF